MKNSKPLAISPYHGIIFGLLLVTVALVTSPALVARYLLSDHNITPGGVDQLNTYRYILSLGGIFFLVAGLFFVENKCKDDKTGTTTVSPKKSFLIKGNWHEHIFLILILGFTLVVGIFLILWLTPNGPGVNPDSVTFIGSAENILEGTGYYYDGDPVTHFPPLYPLSLAATGIFTSNLIIAARILNALLFGVNAVLFTLAVYLSTGRKFLLTVIASLFVLSSQPLINLHVNAFTEPLFLVFSLSSIILISFYSKQPGQLLFIASSLSLGFALATRYIGIGFLPAAGIMVFLVQDSAQIGRRLRNTAAWLALACVPLASVLLRNSILAGSATNRAFTYHPLSLSEYIAKLVISICNFFAPFQQESEALLAIFGLVSVLLIVLVILLFKQWGKQLSGRPFSITFALTCFIFSVSYLIFLWVSISFMDASTPVDSRFVAPMALILSMGLFSAFWAVSNDGRRRWIWLGFQLLIVVSIWSKLPATNHYALDTRANGLGYTAKVWRESETMAFVGSLPAGIKIYSNGSDVIRFLSEKDAMKIPAHTNPLTRVKNPTYGKELSAMCNDIKGEEAIFVYFNLLSWRGYLPSVEDIESSCHLPVLYEFSDGFVFGEK